MKALYPVRIYYDELDSVYYVDARDFGLEGEKLTYGSSYLTAYENAEEALNLLLMDYESEHDGGSAPEASILAPYETYIHVDTMKYKMQMDMQRYFELQRKIVSNSEMIPVPLS